MKIAIVNDVLGGGSNGTFGVTYNLLNHLKGLGHEVRVICADPSKKDDEDYYVVPVKHLGRPLDRYVAKVGVTIPKCSARIMDKALEGVDYIHCMTPFTMCGYAANYAKKHDIPISAGFHVMPENITAYFRLHWLKALNTHIYRKMYRRLYSKVDGVHYPTKFIKDKVDIRVKKQTPAYVVSNGADRIFFKRDVPRPAIFDGKIVVVSTGRYSKEKSQETLIKAVKKSKYKDKIQLVLAGQGARENYYRRLSKRLPIPPIFRVFSKQELSDLLNVADFYVHPAIIELEGIACLEALKCGKLALIADSPSSAASNFAVDPLAVFDCGDSDMLAFLLDYWIDHPDKKAEAEKKTLLGNVKYVDECMLEMDKMFAQIKAKA